MNPLSIIGPALEGRKLQDFTALLEATIRPSAAPPSGLTRVQLVLAALTSPEVATPIVERLAAHGWSDTTLSDYLLGRLVPQGPETPAQERSHAD